MNNGDIQDKMRVALQDLDLGGAEVRVIGFGSKFGMSKENFTRAVYGEGKLSLVEIDSLTQISGMECADGPGDSLTSGPPRKQHDKMIGRPSRGRW
jgi:hypothetical protein